MIVLGIDCGTQSLKTVAVDWETGEVLASANKLYGLLPGLPPGAMEQNPADWEQAMESTLLEVVKLLGKRSVDVLAIGVSGQQHGLVVLDANHSVVRPAKLWCDTSTVSQCDAMTHELGGVDQVITLAGNPILPGYTAPKVRWLFENEPKNWERTKTVLLPHDYLNFCLTGELKMEYGDASGTALLDIRTREWSSKLCSVAAPDLLSKLPPLKDSSQPHGYLSDRFAKLLGLSHQIMVSSGGGDNMMGAIGTGNVESGVVTASLGTSGTLYAYSENPVIDPQGEVAGFCDSTDAWLPLVCTMNVTLVTELVRDLFHWSHDDYDRVVDQAPVGSDGLLLLPYLSGERTPNLPHGTGVLYGMSSHNLTSAHLARAMMEGVTLGLGYGLKRFKELGIRASEIRLTGGGSHSAAWRQICADIFDVPVVCMQSSEGAALGAAIQAGWTFLNKEGKASNLSAICKRLAAVDETTRTRPLTGNRETYQALQERSTRLRKALTEANLL